MKLRTGWKLFSLIFCFLMMAGTVGAQRLKVVGVSAAVIPESYAGLCPRTFMFAGRIKAEGKGTVKYRWSRSDGRKGPVRSIRFEESGTQIVTTSWKLGDQGQNYPDYWAVIQTLSPNRMASNEAVFTLKCAELPDNSNVNDVAIDGIFMDKSCKLWITHSNRSSRRMNLVLREKIWINGKLLENRELTLDLEPGAWINYSVANGKVFPFKEKSAFIKVMIDVDNVLLETNEQNNLMVKRVRCQ